MVPMSFLGYASMLPRSTLAMVDDFTAVEFAPIVHPCFSQIGSEVVSWGAFFS